MLMCVLDFNAIQRWRDTFEEGTADERVAKTCMYQHDRHLLSHIGKCIAVNFAESVREGRLEYRSKVG